MKFYTHKTTSIFVIDVKFYKNPLFRLRDVQFFQTAVTNLSYRYYFFTTTAARSVTSTIWKNDWLKSGVVLIRTLLTAVNQWRDRLHNCVRANGGHFEHLIWTFWLFWLTSTAMETHDLWVMLFKSSYFSKVKADLLWNYVVMFVTEVVLCV